MADKITYRVPFRRRKQGKTDYRKRMALIKSGKNRLVVRKSNREIVVEIMKRNPKGDATLVFASTRELKGIGWNGGRASITAAYLVGLLAGRKALTRGEKEAILDIGLNTAHPKGVLFAVAKGTIDAGLKMNVGEEVLPTMDRIQGKHIVAFALSLSQEKFQKQFSGVLKKGFDPKKAVEIFEKTREAIQKMPENKLKEKHQKS